MSEIEIAFIGGSGLYKIPNFKNSKMVRSFIQFWQSILKNLCWIIKWKEDCFFGLRHGLNHNISPSKINYRAKY